MDTDVTRAYLWNNGVSRCALSTLWGLCFREYAGRPEHVGKTEQVIGQRTGGGGERGRAGEYQRGRGGRQEYGKGKGGSEEGRGDLKAKGKDVHRESGMDGRRLRRICVGRITVRRISVGGGLVCDGLVCDGLVCDGLVCDGFV